MKTSARGIDLIKQFEGLELEAYQDIAGIWTIGYGHTGDVEPGMRISEREAEALLERDLRPRENAVSQLSSVDLNQNEFDALVSFVYNVGADAFRRSTARRRLNRNDRVGAAEALTWWNKATVGGVLREVAGLTRRRAAERALFLEPTNSLVIDNHGALDDNARVTPIEDTPRRDSIAGSRTVQGATVAGGAGVAAATMGQDTAQELDQLEGNIEAGQGLTEDASAGEGSTPPRGERPADQDPEQTGDPATDDPNEDESPADVSDANNDLAAGDSAVEGDSESDMQAGEAVVLQPEPMRPSKHEVHAVEAQVQFALLILILLSVAFIVFARVDDWLKYRR
ncbi:MAG: lysozyme [Pseudomonadota bacterium]